MERAAERNDVGIFACLACRRTVLCDFRCGHCEQRTAVDDLQPCESHVRWRLRYGTMNA